LGDLNVRGAFVTVGASPKRQGPRFNAGTDIYQLVGKRPRHKRKRSSNPAFPESEKNHPFKKPTTHYRITLRVLAGLPSVLLWWLLDC